MKKNKAAGPDKISIDFYQACWDIVKNDLLDMFSEFHQGILNVSMVNYGIITLLPKIQEAERMKGISLVLLVFVGLQHLLFAAACSGFVLPLEDSILDCFLVC